MANRNVEALSSPLYFGSGANRLRVATDGTPTLEGSATVWEDILGNINGANLFSTAGKADYDHDEGCIVFQPSGSLLTSGDVVVVKFQLPHKMKSGSPLKLHIHWRQPNATIVFAWKYRVLENLVATDTAWSADIPVAATGAANSVAYVSGTVNQITMLGNIPTTDVSLSSIVQVKLTRTDATSGDIIIHDIDAHYEADAMGSSQEYIK